MKNSKENSKKSMVSKKASSKNKKILVGATAGVLAIILLITAICLNLGRSQNRMSISTPELARALEYGQFIKAADTEDGVGDDTVDGTANVRFGAFFLRDLDGDGYAEPIKGTCKPIGEEDTLYLELNVLTEGYLKDAKVEIQGQNFYLQTTLPKDEQLKDNYIGNNTKAIEFNQINNGTQKLISGIIRSGDYTYDYTKASAIGNNINNYSREDNKIILTGTYVNAEGEEIQITKEIPLTVDWYGTTKAAISSTNQTNRNLSSRINEEAGTIKLDFSVNTNETDAKLNLSKNHVEGTIPELNGYAPTEVKMTNTVSSNLSFAYDETTRAFVIDRTAQVAEDGKVTTSVARNNSYKIEVTYPLEAYQSLGEDRVTIEIPVQTYYEGYNNPNSQFKNPYKSNTVKATIVANYSNPIPVDTRKEASIDITVGKYVYSPSYRSVISKQKPLKIYNGISEEEKDDTYLVRWYAYTGTDGETTGLVLKETQNGQTQVVDQFIKTDSSTVSMENVTSNIGIYFVGADNFLKEDGWIKVYDEETGNLLKTFTKENWNKHTQSNPYKYELPVKHIRVETSATNKESSLYVYNVKELDDEYITTNYTKEEFDNLRYIKSTLSGYLGEKYIATDTHQAYYEVPYSIATINISNSNISTQATEEHEKITITANYDANSNQVGWVDGSFLVKMPQEILDVKINSVEINNASVAITTYELIEKDEGQFIKINTKNNNDEEQSYTITIDADITPDPRIASATRPIELYASNNAGVDYYYKTQDIYDVNDNLNTEEIVNKATTSINLVAPGSLLTSQTASEYDKKGSIAVSPEVADIIPIYAKVDNEKQTAKIGVQLKNNYSSTISEVKLLGKIPFEGNTTVVSKIDLKSEFTTKMESKGLTVPEELQGKVTIYYSENETPDRDLAKAENGWTLAENVTNWDNIKTFLIDFEDEVIAPGKDYVFYYTIEIPQGVEFNKTSYSHHGIYFCLDTEQGKYKTQTEPNKIGFRIAEKFNLEITKTQTGKEKLVPGATYSVTEILKDGTAGDAKTAVTNTEGALTVKNLYAERTYEIKEIKTPEDYELNEDVIRIIGHVAEDGTLTIEKTQGTTKEDIAVIKNEGEMHKVTTKVEDEAKAKLKITKKEQGTENAIQGVKYKLKGYGLPTNGRILTTNVNGEVTVNGLKINEEYILEETRANGYYLASQIKFKIVNNDGIYAVETIEGTIAQNSVTEEDSLPIANLTLEDEKIPTYNLEIFKIKKTVETTLSTDELIAKAEGNLAGEATDVLEGAKFKLYKDDKEIGEYITGADGKIIINNLYQYVEGKDENATYTLKEVLAPNGYAKVKDLTFKAQVVDGTLKIINIDGTEEKFTVEGSTIKLLIEDSPSFKLIKKDAETKAPLANIKFAIYNVDEGEVPATNSKGEIIGTKETINGKEYYTISTDENGIITADLTEGFYKAVEVQAPDKYDISKSTYYFGIGASREGKKTGKAEWAKGIRGADKIKSVAETSDGGYIVGGYFQSSTIDPGNGLTLNNKGSANGMVIKYDESGNVEWAKAIGGSYEDIINSVAETRDGGYIIGGNFTASTIDLGNGVTLTNNNGYDGMLIKYDASGKAEWAKSIGSAINSVAETSDGAIIAGGHFESSTIDLGNGVTLNNAGSWDGMLIKYNALGEVEWAKGIGGSATDEIRSVAETSDGAIIAGGHFESSTIDLGNGVTLNNKGSDDGMIIKYDAEGNTEWVKGIGGSSPDTINSVAETSDGGYAVGGYFKSNTIDLGNGMTLTNNGNTSYNDGMIIKYDVEGEVEWAKVIGGSNSDSIYSVASTSDGGIIVGGDFKSYIIDIENGVTLNNNNYGNDYDGMLIKYDESGEVEWAKVIGGTSEDGITSLTETSDGGYAVGGDFQSSTIDLGNGVTLTNNGSTSYNYGMVIKFSEVEVPEIVVKQAKVIGESSNDQIKSVAETSDGGYIVGGYFKSSAIDLGNGVTLTNNGITSYYDGMVIKYDASGRVEWAKGIGGSFNDYITSVAETSDGGYIVGGDFQSSTIDLENGVTLNNNAYDSDGMLIKYDAEGNVEWAKVIGGRDIDQIESVASTRDGGCIVGGYFRSSTIDLGNGVTLTNNGITSYYDGMVIKYDASGRVEWAKGIGGSNEDHIYSVAETRDGGIIVGGYFQSSTIDLENGVTLNNRSTSYNNGMIIKYDASGRVEWAKVIGGRDIDQIESVASTSDGGYIVGGRYSSGTIDLGNGVTLRGDSMGDGMVIKYDASGEAEWAKRIGGDGFDYIVSATETSDGGYIIGGYFCSHTIDLGNGVILKLNTEGSGLNCYDGMVIKYNAFGEVEWAKVIGESNHDYIYSVAETSNGEYVVGGIFGSSTIDLENGVTLNNAGNYDGMLIKVVEEMGVPEVQELTVENERKQFKITTDVKEIDGIKGGSISGEDYTPYEKVKYGDTNTKEIIMTPDENYEIIGITVNGKEYPFTANEDGTYTMPSFTNITEDKHIEVTYSLKDNKIIINKVDSETRDKLPGATFKLDQIEEREEPQNVIGALTDNGQEYIETDTTKEITAQILGTLTDNGQEYSKADTTKEVTGVLGELTNNGTYYFVEQEGKFVPTNSKTYLGTTTGLSGTANSYIPVDLTGKTGKYAVVVNANISSEQRYDFGYATITENTSAPGYSSTSGQFVYISGTITAKDYTSMILEGGKTYYLHLGYRKDGSGDTGTDQIEFNSIKVYEATIEAYNFIENEEGGYESTNQSQASTVSNSYIPVDLTDKTGKYAVVVNANVSSQSGGDYGYATITENTNRPAYNSGTGRFISISGTSTSVTTPTDYTTMLEGGKLYYLHLGYYKNASTDTGDDKFTVNSVKVYETKTLIYNFIENETGGYESTNQGQNNKTANSYIPIDLTSHQGKYNLIVNANISSDSSDYGYATVTENTNRPAYNSSTGRFIYISGTSTTVTTPTDYTTVLEGGKLYYLHFGYYKNGSTSTGDDKFTINNISVTLNDSDLYHTEVTTNSEGQAITQIPFGKYSITETKAPEGYELNENSIVVEFRAGGNHEFTIENNKLAKVIVHHYLKGTTTKVAEDDTLQDKIGYPYSTQPHLDLQKYELEKGEDGNYVIPENATGQFVSGEQEVIYYYVEKEIPLIVNHYIEETEIPVPLLNGNNAETVTSQGKEGESYTTTAIPDSELSNEYELVEVPSNSTGTYQGDRIEVTYYYKRVVRDLTINKYTEDGRTPLAGAEFTILNKDESKNQIIKTEEIQNNGTYFFKKDGNKYVSNNKGQNSSVANSYIKIDLTKSGDVDLVVNAEISSEGADKGYATITESTKAPTYSSSTGRFIYISGTSTTVTTPTDYTTVLEGGKTYYLHLGYRKDGSVDTGTDTFTINSIKIDGKDYKQYLTYTTDANGKINKSLEAGEYVITEVQAPEGYQLPENPSREITISKDTTEVSLDITNIKKQGKVIVHYYLEGTETPVPLTDGTPAQDVTKTGNVGDIYATTGATNVNAKYELVAVPDNSSGNITEEEIVVTYYYRLKDTSVLVHHYKEGTTTSLSDDVTIPGKVDDLYTTTVANNIPSKYELVATPANATGKMTEAQIVVTYYYRLKDTSVLVHHYIEGTTTKLSDDVTIEGQVDDEYTTKVANDIPSKYELVATPANATGKMTEAQTVVTYYYRLKDTSVLVHHYLENTTQPVSLDVTIPGKVDDEYTTEVASNILDVYELIETPENATGIMTEEQTVVTYYYSLRVAKIEYAKTQQVETGKNFVKEWDKITYTVTISNSGNLGKDVVVKDSIPTGTTLVTGSVKIDGAGQTSTTAQDLANGIVINVPKAENGEASVRTLSFEVTVNEGATGDIRNIAIVDEENTNETTVPVITYEKTATITRREAESTLAENEVTAGDTIKYVIKVHNTGSEKVEAIDVKDTVPEGTELKTIENGGVQIASEISWTIPEIEANKTAVVGFTVEVKYLRKDTIIRNKATVEGKETNETENPYKKLPLVEESKVEKTATEKITTKDMKVYYEINFTTTINYFDGRAKITLVDTLPYPIDEEESQIDGGTYDATTKTITWKEELNNLPVIIDGMTIERTKTLNLKFDYGNINEIPEKLVNKVNSRIDLLEPSEENPDEYVGVKVDEREDTAETLIGIPAQVKAHHYIYDAEKNEYTTVKLAEDETINGIIGKEYTTTPSTSVPKNYICLNTTPENYAGKMTEETIEVTYYYQLATPIIENTIEKTAVASKTATASKEDENGVAILTNENGVVTYNIKYNVTIKDYIGKATIEIVDTLPEAIDAQKSDLVDGKYDEATKIITWKEDVQGIDTYANGTFTKEITKQIKIVYSNQDVLKDLVNTVTGTSKVYYPEKHTTKPGEVLETKTATDEETVKQEYKVTLKVNKKWEDNENYKGKRPESVTIEIKGEPEKDIITKVLNAENEWKCEITDLPKYDAKGNKIEYQVTEKETETGDLEFYEEAQIKKVETQTEEVTNYVFTVTNAYKLLNTDLITELTKQGTKEITSSKDVVEYTIKLKTEVIDYIGTGKVKIVDMLPYKIDEEKSELAEGIYDDEQQTITWEEELPHINTDVLGESYKQDITKQIKVVYKDIDLTAEKMANHVNAKVELYDSDEKDEHETSHDTNINVNGKVIVRYVDKDTGKDIDVKYNQEITGKVGTDYTSEPKEIENYYYIESTKNETGKIKEETQEVIYYYTRIESSVLVKYQDTEGNKLAEDVFIKGKIGDKYTTEQKEIENYKFVSVTDNKEGTMTKEQIVVIYVYDKIPAKVIVKYLEKDPETGEDGEEKELLPQETIEGFVGDDYTTERKVIENYKLSEPEPENKTGKMTEKTIEVIYYYERIPSGVLTVMYVDKDTGEEILETEEKTYRYEIKGFVGDEYETEEKVIPYYVFVESTENIKGVLTEKEDVVKYYYRKQTFNLSVEKIITGMTVNGKAERITNNKFAKLEIRAKNIKNTEIIVNYVINVKNDGEIKGKAKLTEIIPQGYKVIDQEAYWRLSEGILETDIELEPGEERDLVVKLRWSNNQNNVGIRENIAKLIDIENPANYDEISLDDNISNAQVMVGITTGPKFEDIFKIELAASIVIMLLLILNINNVSIIRKKK